MDRRGAARDRRGMDALIRLAHSQPNIVTFLAVPGALAGLAVLLPVLRRRLTGHQPEEKVTTAALDGLKAVATFLVFILAVSLNQAINQLRVAEEVVQREAGLLVQLDRGLLRVGEPALAALRPLLADYLRLVVEEEWPRMAEGERSERAAEALAAVQRAVRATEVSLDTPRRLALYADMMRAMEGISDARDQRLLAMRVSLPGVFWAAILVGGLILLPLCAMTAGHLTSALVKASIVGAIGVLIALVVVLDRPFAGESAVKAAPFERAMERNARRG